MTFTSNSNLKRNAGPNALRRGRASVPNRNYFVTVCLDPRKPILIPEVASAVLSEVHAMTEDGAWALRCITIMPDHLHLMFVLGERLSLSQAIARLKTKTQVLVRHSRTDWQDNFYDHCLRPEDSVEAVIRYIC